MKINDAQLRRIIREELLMSEALSLAGRPSIKSRWKTKASKLHTNPGLLYAQENLDTATELVNKIGKSARKTKQLLNSTVGKGAVPVTGSALLGALRKFSRKLTEPLRLAGKALKVLNELQRISNLVKRGAMSPATALELFGKTFAGHAFDQALSILTLGLGGLFGPVASAALGPLSDPLHNRVQEINNNLDIAYEATNWLKVIEDDPELRSLLDPDLDKGLVASIEQSHEKMKADSEKEIEANIGKKASVSIGKKASDYDSKAATPDEMRKRLVTLPTGTLSKGTGRSSGVVLLQRALASVGAWDGGETGVFDDSLKKSLKSFQKDVGIGADGVYGPNTAKELTSAVQSSRARRAGSMMAERKIRITRKEFGRIIQEELRILRESKTKSGKKIEDHIKNEKDGNKYRAWANSSEDLKKKYGKKSKFDLDSTGKYNNSYIKKSWAAGGDDYLGALKKDPKAIDKAVVQAKSDPKPGAKPKAGKQPALTYGFSLEPDKPVLFLKKFKHLRASYPKLVDYVNKTVTDSSKKELEGFMKRELAPNGISVKEWRKGSDKGIKPGRGKGKIGFRVDVSFKEGESPMVKGSAIKTAKIVSDALVTMLKPMGYKGTLTVKRVAFRKGAKGNVSITLV